jgi:transcriptional regulator with XRE-family HTH domain
MGKSRNTVFIAKVASRIKDLREKHGITQEVFFYDTGINIGRIERGERDISLSTLMAVCDYFDITIQEFFSKVK